MRSQRRKQQLRHRLRPLVMLLFAAFVLTSASFLSARELCPMLAEVETCCCCDAVEQAAPLDEVPDALRRTTCCGDEARGAVPTTPSSFVPGPTAIEKPAIGAANVIEALPLQAAPGAASVSPLVAAAPRTAPRTSRGPPSTLARLVRLQRFLC